MSPDQTAQWLTLLHAETDMLPERLEAYPASVWQTWGAWRSQIAHGGNPIAACIPLAILPEVAMGYQIPELATAPCIGKIIGSTAEWTWLTQSIPGLHVATLYGAPDLDTLRLALHHANEQQRQASFDLSLYPLGGPSDGITAYIDALTITGHTDQTLTGLLGTPAHESDTETQWRWA
nr:hypothetical protein [Actinomyces sp.]